MSKELTVQETQSKVEAVDKEKTKLAFTRGVVSLEIIKLKELPESAEEAEKLYDDLVRTKTYLVDDLSEPYMIRLAYTENKTRLKSADPDNLDDGDTYELSETIQDILRENGLAVIQSQFPEKPEEA